MPILSRSGRRGPPAWRDPMAGASRIPEIETWDRAAISIQHVVGFSNADCIGALVEHLVGQGARCIAFIGG